MIPMIPLPIPMPTPITYAYSYNPERGTFFARHRSDSYDSYDSDADAYAYSDNPERGTFSPVIALIPMIRYHAL